MVKQILRFLLFEGKSHLLWKGLWDKDSNWMNRSVIEDAINNEGIVAGAPTRTLATAWVWLLYGSLLLHMSPCLYCMYSVAAWLSSGQWQRSAGHLMQSMELWTCRCDIHTNRSLSPSSKLSSEFLLLATKYCGIIKDLNHSLRVWRLA